MSTYTLLDRRDIDICMQHGGLLQSFQCRKGLSVEIFADHLRFATYYLLV